VGWVGLSGIAFGPGAFECRRRGMLWSRNEIAATRADTYVRKCDYVSFERNAVGHERTNRRLGHPDSRARERRSYPDIRWLAYTCTSNGAQRTNKHGAAASIENICCARIPDSSSLSNPSTLHPPRLSPLSAEKIDAHEPRSRPLI